MKPFSKPSGQRRTTQSYSLTTPNPFLLPIHFPLRIQYPAKPLPHVYRLATALCTLASHCSPVHCLPTAPLYTAMPLPPVQCRATLLSYFLCHYMSSDSNATTHSSHRRAILVYYPNMTPQQDPHTTNISFKP